jgi:serine/threonine-protein kinase
VSVTFGAAGIAYALLRIARIREDAELLALADLWSEAAARRAWEADAFYQQEIEITPEAVGRVSPYHTASGIALVQALVAHARCDRIAFETAVANYLELTAAECRNPDVTLGRSGVLLGQMLLIEAGGRAAIEGLQANGDSLLDGIWQELDSEAPIRECSRIAYLGMAHGWAGLIYTALRWSALTGTPPRPSIGDRLSQLEALAAPAGCGVRWPVHSTGSDGFSMPGWCNGGAGYVFLWALAHRLFGEERFLRMAERAAEESFGSGGGGHSLCCGWAGQSYAQLALYHHTGERRWLDHARELAARAIPMASLNIPGMPYSLYKGSIGVAVLAADLEQPETATMPFFAEEGWV